MKISKRVKFTVILAPLLFVVAFVLILALYGSYHKPPEVEVMPTGFVPQSIQITEGETIRFVNRSATMSQMLCLGSDQHCGGFSLGPASLKSPGLQIAPGQGKDITFDSYGKFSVTSTAVPGMNLKVTVIAAL